MTLDEYQEKALSTNINLADKKTVFYDRMFGLVGEAVELADKVKKWIRDDKADWKKLDKEMMALELGDVLWYVATLADTMGFTLEEVGQQNLRRLKDRKQRGKLSGAGDHR